MFINSKPWISFPPLFYGGKFSDTHRVFFFNSGSEAICFKIIHSGILPGRKILLPSYCCMEVVNKLITYGYDIRYIEPLADLTIDECLLREIIEKDEIAAYIHINYFGTTGMVSGETISFLQDKKVELLIDCCHTYCNIDALVKAKHNYSFIFSLRKISPVPDGGLLIMNFDNKGEDIRFKKYNFFFKNFFFIIKEKILLNHKFRVNGLRKVENSLISFVSNLYNNSPLKFRRLKVNNSLSPLMQPSVFVSYLLKNNDLIKSIVTLRIANFNRLYLYCDSLKIKVINLKIDNAGIQWCPQVLPILDTTKTLLSFMHSNSIYAYRWPYLELPKEVLGNNQFPTANFFMENIVCIPIHQDLTCSNLEYIEDVIGKWKKSFD